GLAETFVVPVGVGGRSTFGREDDETLAVGEVGERCRSLHTRPCSSHRKEQQRTALEVPADLPVVRPELLDDPCVPILWLGHAPSSAVGYDSLLNQLNVTRVPVNGVPGPRMIL